jgi:signal transduction histidine kinase/ActR/RegA family two-component response regulator
MRRRKGAAVNPGAASSTASTVRAQDGMLRSFEGELLGLIARHSRRTLPSSLGSTALLFGLLVQELDWHWPAVWALIVGTVNWRHTRLLTRLDTDPRPEATRLRWVVFTFTRAGLAWSSVFAFFPFVSVVAGAVMSIFVVGVTSAALNASVGYGPAYRPLAVIMMVPLAVSWGLFAPGGTPLFERLMFALLSAMFLSVVLQYARGVFTLFKDSYEIRAQRVELLAQLRDALDRATSASQAKTRFLAAASHDLRQPIQALMLFSGALRGRTLDAHSTMIATQIDTSVQNLAYELDGLLDISKLDAAVVQPSMLDFDLTAVLQDLHGEIEPLARQKHLEATLSCGEQLRVRSDPYLLQRMLRNLLSNAVKYTGLGSVHLRAQRQDDGVRVEVIDTGPGIPEAEQERVFEEFYQLHNPERDRARGLGLGLAIVRRLADLLACRIELQSSPGEGTRFGVLVPLAPPDALLTPEPAAAAAEEGPVLDILVVDDEEPIRIGLQSLLGGRGHTVRIASSTEEALRLACERAPQLVLADLRLRGQDSGLRVIAALREQMPALPALLMSGDILDEQTAPERLKAVRESGLILLQKPVAPDDLLRAISGALPS